MILRSSDKKTPAEKIHELRETVARLQAERDAAAAEVERLRADLLEAIPSAYAEMGLTDYVHDLHRQLAQLTQALNAARAAAATWKRAAKWRRWAARQIGGVVDDWNYKTHRRWYAEDGHD